MTEYSTTSDIEAFVKNITVEEILEGEISLKYLVDKVSTMFPAMLEYLKLALTDCLGTEFNLDKTNLKVLDTDLELNYLLFQSTIETIKSEKIGLEELIKADQDSTTFYQQTGCLYSTYMLTIIIEILNRTSADNQMLLDSDIELLERTALLARLHKIYLPYRVHIKSAEDISDLKQERKQKSNRQRKARTSAVQDYANEIAVYFYLKLKITSKDELQGIVEETLRESNEKDLKPYLDIWGVDVSPQVCSKSGVLLQEQKVRRIINSVVNYFDSKDSVVNSGIKTIDLLKPADYKLAWDKRTELNDYLQLLAVSEQISGSVQTEELIELHLEKKEKDFYLPPSNNL